MSKNHDKINNPEEVRNDDIEINDVEANPEEVDAEAAKEMAQEELTKEEALEAISLAVREFAMDKMYETIARYNKCGSKRIYYLSIEYLIGRSLENNLHNLGLFDILKDIKIDDFPDFSLQEIFDFNF